MSRAARILVVDDEKIIRNILKKLLLSLGHKALTAAGSEDAVALVKEQRPDIVLLDIVLPGGNSMDVVKAIRQAGGNKRTEIIMISSHDNLDTMASYMKAGAGDFLLKPFNATLFKARINRTLANIHARQTIKKLQSRLSESELKLQMAEQGSEIFCSNLCHDLNNALTGILMSAEMMLLADPPAASVQSIMDIMQSSDQISAIIKTHRTAIENPKSASASKTAA